MLKGIFIELIISYDLFFVVEYQKDSISEWIKIEMIINSKNTAREDFKNSCNRHYGTDSVHKLWNYSFHQFVRKRFIAYTQEYLSFNAIFRNHSNTTTIALTIKA